MKLKSIIFLTLIMAAMQSQAQTKPKPKKATSVWSDDWETPNVKKNGTKTAKSSGVANTQSRKRKTKG